MLNLIKETSNRWFSARLQYLQCVSNGDTAVLHWAIEMYISIFYHFSTLKWAGGWNPAITDNKDRPIMVRWLTMTSWRKLQGISSQCSPGLSRIIMPQHQGGSLFVHWIIFGNCKIYIFVFCRSDVQFIFPKIKSAWQWLDSHGGSWWLSTNLIEEIIKQKLA